MPEPEYGDGRAGWATPVAVASAVLFLASAGVATRLAYDPAAAGVRLAQLLIGFGVCGVLLVGRLWVFTGVGYVATLLALGLGFWARFANPDAAAVMAGALVILLPLQAGGVLLAHLRGRRLEAELLGAAWALSVWLLILTGERSAWLAAGAGAVAAVLCSRPAGPARRVWLWGGAGGAARGAVVYVALLAGPPELLNYTPLLGDEIAGRAALWRQMLGLAADYRFTGSGLGMTALVASSYLFLLHVPLFHHAHNTLIQIVLEQGVAGGVGFGGMAVAAAGMACALAGRADRTLRVLGACGLAAVVIAVAHGLLDSELYASAWVPVFFLPFGYCGGAQVYAWRNTPRLPTRVDGRRWVLRRLGAVAAVVVVGLGLWGALGGRAAWYANLGALAQTQAELSVYHWPDWGFQDQVRRDPGVDLEPAMAYLRAALAVDPANVTALRRLGQIALAREEYAAAHAYLLAAYAAQPQDRAVRQYLGESYALAGDASDAARLWQSIDVTHGQLGLRQGWYQALGDSRHQQCMQEAIELYERGLAPP